MLLLTKAVFVIMIGFLFSVVLGLIMIPLLKELGVGQRISEFVVEAHRKKEGTPTMGGLMFVIPTVLVTLGLVLTHKIDYTSNLGIVLLVFIGYTLIGFLDDFFRWKLNMSSILDSLYKIVDFTFLNLLYLLKIIERFKLHI